MKKKLLTLALMLILSVSQVLSVGASSAGGYGYGMLDEKSAFFYDQLLDNIAVLRRGEQALMELDVAANELEAYQDALTEAIEALLWDHQEIFWVKNWSCTWNWTMSSSGIYHGVFSVTLHQAVNWSSGARSVEDDAEVLGDLSWDMAQTARAAGWSRYDQLLYLHDWLTNNNVYNSLAVKEGANKDALAWTPLSALSADLSPVCEGYARAFMLVCQELEIPCIIVSGNAKGPHMWNYVQMEDGQWYGVDVTFDDPIFVGAIPQVVSGIESHDYFLKGSDSFLRDRTEDDLFAYPVLSVTDYDPNTKPTAPVDPEPKPEPKPEPDPEPEPEYDPSVYAFATPQTVKVDDVPVDFQMYQVRTGDGSGTNYIRIRDLAYILNGSAAQFEVEWDQESKSIFLAKGKDYIAIQSEMNPGYTGNRVYTSETSNIYIDGELFVLNIISIPDSNGNGDKYFRLRDLGQKLDFNVGFKVGSGVFIESAKAYNDKD